MGGEILLAICGVLIGLVGIVVAVVEARKYRGPLLCYQYHGSNLILSYDAVFPETIEVSFGGEKVPNLTHSQVVVWNRGGSPMKGSDVSANDPLFLRFGGGSHILQAEIVKISKESNLFSIKYKPLDETIGLSFDFLDENDGALLSVWHTGREIEPVLEGTLIHSKAGPYKLGRFIGPRPNVSKSRKEAGAFEQVARLANGFIRSKPQVITMIIAFMGLSMAIVFAVIFVRDGLEMSLPYVPEKGPDEEPGLMIFIVPIIFGLIYALMGIFLWLQVRRRFPKNLLPNDYSTDN